MSEQGYELTVKFRRIVLPTVTLSVTMLCGYSSFNYLLVARSALVPLDEDIATYWLPLGISCLLVLLFITPALSMLEGDEDRYKAAAMMYGRSDPRARKCMPGSMLSDLSSVAAIAVVALPTILAQTYIRMTTGEITHIRSATDVASRSPTRFYSVDAGCFDHTQAGFVSGISLDIDTHQVTYYEYAVAPFCDPRVQSHPASVWVGIKYQENQLTSSWESAERQKALTEFLERSQAQFQKIDPHSFGYFERLGRNPDRKSFMKALQHAGVDIEAQSLVLLIPHEEPFEKRAGHRLAWALGSLPMAALGWFVLVLACPFAPRRLTPSISERFSWLLPRRNTYGLVLLAEANLLVFLAMAIAGVGFFVFDKDDLLHWGANYRPELHGFGILRLVSSQFLHFGFVHLALNVYGLIIAGCCLRPVTGNAGLISCYLLTGLGANITSAQVYPTTVTVGASGAIFGLYGILLVLLLVHDPRLDDHPHLLLTGPIFMVASLTLGAIAPEIGNAAHIGGLLTGAVVGILIYGIRRVTAAPSTQASVAD